MNIPDTNADVVYEHKYYESTTCSQVLHDNEWENWIKNEKGYYALSEKKTRKSAGKINATSLSNVTNDKNT